MSNLHQSTFSIRTRMQELAEILDRDWDAEFDTIYDDLEREFAEFRFQINHIK